MNNRTQAEVIINGKQYSIIGCESEEYLQKVASYINSKYSEIRAQKWFKEVSPDMREVVLQINIADDYFKMKSKLAQVSEEAEERDNEIYRLKHDLIAAQGEAQELQRKLEKLQQANMDEQKKSVRLETELNGYRKKYN
ncbi:MAG: cell division protein ZapA [Lachnospiraceae bacterium]|jgi:cell division protein ZapA|nr:cell division protein ZapA [Lachnospiraceae bacterium]MBO4669286.1 cell division protein ZapA [Lachnospiraceae bacterium]MBO6066349.1 cell division protein ZapA [Lachnospiraceae bacterium]MBR5667502.1 cell division protein ZapA [Lachnospiraceae bacterium]MCR5466166.1 cell division protein ZapA [Lachnospiraceae bacterium]